MQSKVPLKVDGQATLGAGKHFHLCCGCGPAQLHQQGPSAHQAPPFPSLVLNPLGLNILDFQKPALVQRGLLNRGNRAQGGCPWAHDLEVLRPLFSPTPFWNKGTDSQTSRSDGGLSRQSAGLTRSGLNLGPVMGASAPSPTRDPQWNPAVVASGQN